MLGRDSQFIVLPDASCIRLVVVIIQLFDGDRQRGGGYTGVARKQVRQFNAN